MDIANCKFLGCCIVFLLIRVAPDDSDSDVASNPIPHTPSVLWRSTDSIEMGRGVGSMGNHSMGWLPAYSPSIFSYRLSSPRQHSDWEESAASEMHELKQDLEGKVGQGVCADFETFVYYSHRSEISRFLLNYDYLVKYDDGVIPTILPYPYLRDNHYFTGKDVKAIQEYLKFIINSLLDLKIGKDRVTRTYISKAIKSYRNTLESYLALRNSKIENGKRKGAHLPPYDSPYKPLRSVKPNGSKYKTRQKGRNLNIGVTY